MATLYEDALQRVKEASNKLARLHADPSVSLGQLTAVLSEYRRACTSAVHADYLDACKRKVETELWEAHSKINGLFRKHMHGLKKGGRGNAVEIRKETKLYLEFLRSSQRFYRNFICELDLCHGGITELRRVARTLEPQQVQTKAAASSADSELKEKLVQSCYNTLIRLGDLSRYRETECSNDAPKWGPAVGYYNLAIDIYPHSGVAHNQLAVIALHDQSHVRSMYHLYRAIATREPHPRGRANLEIEFKKIIAAWDKGELIKPVRTRGRDGTSTKALSAWFVRLHSKCYLGEDFASHAELEDEVLGQMKTAIQDPGNSALLLKIVLINISAEWLVTKKVEGGEQTPQNLKSFYFYLQLNARTFALLLETLLADFQKSTPVVSDAYTMSSKMRRCASAIRLYSFWLSQNAHILSADLNDTSVRTRLKEMWRLYAALLTKAASLVLRNNAPTLNYMLEEDVDTIGFLPLFKHSATNQWFIDGVPKPRFNDEGVERHLPAVEDLARLRDVVIAGTQDISEKGLPIVYQNLQFAYKEDHELATESSNVRADLQVSQAASTPGPSRLEPALVPPQGGVASSSSKRSKSNSTSTSRETMMNRMVDELVGDDSLDALPEDDEGPVTPPTNSLGNSPMIRDLSNSIGALTASDMVNQVQTWSTKNSTLNANASPFVRSIPSPKDDIWVRTGATSNPSSPHQNVIGSQRASPQAYAPLPSSTWHSRHPSDNVPSVTTNPLTLNTSSFRPDGNSALTPTMPSAFGDLGNVWGISSAVPTAEWVRQKQPRWQDALTSSMLFGKHDNRWDSLATPSATGRTSTPANGQGG